MGARPVSFGVFLFPQVAPYDRVRDLAVRSEALGFDHAWVADQTPMSAPQYIRLEAWSLLGALARDTATIRLGTLVTSAPFRHPLMLAAAVATVDHASAGRVTLGIGAGGLPEDLAGVGLSDGAGRSLADRLSEVVDTTHRLLSGETVTREGGFYPTRDATVERPMQQPRVPMWVAAQGPRTLALAARYADGWSSLGGQPLFGDRRSEQAAIEVAREHLARLGAECDAIGRDPASLVPSVMTWRTRAYESVEALTDWVGSYRAAGFRDFVLYWIGDPALDEVVERFAVEVMPGFREPR